LLEQLGHLFLLCEQSNQGHGLFHEPPLLTFFYEVEQIGQYTIFHELLAENIVLLANFCGAVDALGDHPLVLEVLEAVDHIGDQVAPHWLHFGHLGDVGVLVGQQNPEVRDVQQEHLLVREGVLVELYHVHLQLRVLYLACVVLQLPGEQQQQQIDGVPESVPRVLLVGPALHSEDLQGGRH
jgi:hypothetical protein